MDQIQTSSRSGGLLHFFFERKIAAKLQLKCSMLPATPDDAFHPAGTVRTMYVQCTYIVPTVRTMYVHCTYSARWASESLSTTHLVAISNQVRQRNECYKQFVKSFILRKHSNKRMGKGCVKMAKNDLKYFILLN